MADAPLFRNIAFLGKAGTGAFKLGAQQFGWKCTEKSLPETVFAEAGSNVVSAEWQPVCGGGKCLLKFTCKGVAGSIRFAGFAETDRASIKVYLQSNYNVELKEQAVSIAGWSWGDWQLSDDASLKVTIDGKLGMELDVSELSQVTTVGKTDLNLEFQDDTAAQPQDEVLQSIRFFVPSGTNGEGAGNTTEELKEKIQRAAQLSVSGDSLAQIRDVTIVAPRGKHDLEFYPKVVKVRGKTLSYTIKYDSISRLFLLDMPGAIAQKMLVLGLSVPLRHGNQSHALLGMLMETSSTVDESQLPEDVWTSSGLVESRNGILEARQTYVVVTKLFKEFSKQAPVSPADGFKAANPYKIASIECSYKTQRGHMFFFKKSVLWVSKPITWLTYKNISSVEFSESTLRTSTFDLVFNMKGTKFEFMQIEQKVYEAVLKFLSENDDLKGKIVNLDMAEKRVKAMNRRQAEPTVAGQRAAAARRPAATGSKPASKEDGSEDEDYNEDEDGDFEDEDASEAEEEDEEDAESDEAPKKKRPRRGK
ncbi:unnamed protein product [Polarella glacialis]|uniref:FACT complex subunit SSRP1 n=1 Tax=Polarella glacialis TaxID=89957 RepID=A0A813DMU3_POLGL|nr:unnamed protein product [Polarella glacialis]